MPNFSCSDHYSSCKYSLLVIVPSCPSSMDSDLFSILWFFCKFSFSLLILPFSFINDSFRWLWFLHSFQASYSIGRDTSQWSAIFDGSPNIGRLLTEFMTMFLNSRHTSVANTVTYIFNNLRTTIYQVKSFQGNRQSCLLRYRFRHVTTWLILFKYTKCLSWVYISVYINILMWNGSSLEILWWDLRRIRIVVEFTKKFWRKR